MIYLDIIERKYLHEENLHHLSLMEYKSLD